MGDFGDEKQVRVTWRFSHFSDGKPVLGFDICRYVRALFISNKSSNG